MNIRVDAKDEFANSAPIYLSVCLSIYIRVDAKDEFANSAPRVHLPQGLAHPLLFQVHLYVYVHSYISTYIHMYLNT